jgi:cytochrome c biogenesis protein CcmG/thiol:disulfide interchange protein DsbE
MQDPPIGHPSDRTGSRPGARRTARRFTAGLGLMLLIGMAAYVSTLPLGGAPTASRAPDASFHVSGIPVEGVGIGQSAPDFVGADNDHGPLLMDLDGKPIRLDDFAGEPLWIVFWATWCTPCQQEASDIRALYHAHREDDLAVLAIDIQEPAAAVREYALGHDLDYAIGLDSTAAVMALYGGWGLPSHFFLDGNGVIVDRYFGQMTGELMEQHLRSIIGS